MATRIRRVSIITKSIETAGLCPGPRARRLGIHVDQVEEAFHGARIPLGAHAEPDTEMVREAPAIAGREQQAIV